LFGSTGGYAIFLFPQDSGRILAYALNQVLDSRKLSQTQAADVLGVTQPKISALRNYKLAGFSVERLMNLLTALDQDIEIVVRHKPRSRKSGRITVVAV
jgi:predicted XRE-type DNA-binding protein